MVSLPTVIAAIKFLGKKSVMLVESQETVVSKSVAEEMEVSSMSNASLT